MSDLRSVGAGSAGNSTLFPANKDAEVTAKVGYLIKKSRNKTGRLTNWRKRYFVLTNNCLKYYKDEEEAESEGAPRGYVYLQQRTKICENSERKNCFQIKSPGQKPMTVQCTDEAEMHEWMNLVRELSAEAAPSQIKLVLVGDHGEGKEELLREFFIECNQKDLVKKIKWENNIMLDLEVTGKRVTVTICLVDSRGLASLRALHYIGANAFMMCFSSSDKRTFDSIESTWHKEIQNDSVPTFLVGIKTKNYTMVQRTRAEALSEYLGTEGYFDVRLEANGGKPKTPVDEGIEEEDAFVTTPAETFLTVLEATLDYMEEIESNDSNNDVANLDDFRREGFGFVDAVKQKVSAFRKFMAEKQPSIRMFSGSISDSDVDESVLSNTVIFDDDEFIRTDNDNAKKESSASFSSFGAIQTFRKYFPARIKKSLAKKQPLSPVETQKAHFLNREKTGSLIFLGVNGDSNDDFMLDDSDDNDNETPENVRKIATVQPAPLSPQRLGGGS